MRTALFGFILAGTAGPAFPLDTLTPGSVAAQARAKIVKAVIAPAPSTLKRGLSVLRKNRISATLKARQNLRSGTIERKVMAWAIAVYGKGVDTNVLSGIANDLSDWPNAGTLQANVEIALTKTLSDAELRTVFSQSRPETVTGSIALVRTCSGDLQA